MQISRKAPSRCSSVAWGFVFFGLCFNLGPILECDHDAGVLGDGHMIYHRQPVLIPEDCQRLPLLQVRQEHLDSLPSGLSVCDLLGQLILTGFCGVEPSYQRIVAFLVFGLIEGNVSVFFDALLDELSSDVDFSLKRIH